MNFLNVMIEDYKPPNRHNITVSPKNLIVKKTKGAFCMIPHHKCQTLGHLIFDDAEESKIKLKLFYDNN